MPAGGYGADKALPRGSSADVMDGGTSSKVTVEYHDPSGIFPAISGQIAERLPLKNLHWKSPSRPLRSIDSLHIDFVPSPETPVDGSGAPHGDAASAAGTRNDSQPPGQAPEPSVPAESAKSAPKERRHQIPGLRQNPYLKIYLLRCDDNDTYKSTSRKQIRDWMRHHTPPSQASNSVGAQEGHDAFEWLILHVVFPDTPAASQTRWSGASGSLSSTSVEKATSASRWPGRSSSTLFEKLRADFNVSSKSAPDRVAQIRLPKEAASSQLQAPPRPTSPPIETAQERENAWNDLITKMKTLILMSFDLRVSQYEDDIREKDSQRSLPGWNFCTFFLLKEGLARGFENVGLVEDALVGYDELSIGLDSVIREQAVEGHEGHGGVFPSYTEDLVQELLAQKDGKSVDSSICDKPIDTRRKRYRDLILSNNISIFDFKCYIFARQMSLLLRLGNAQSARAELLTKLRTRDDSSLPNKHGAEDERLEDAASLAELCERALSFITMAARDLRADLYRGAKEKGIASPDALINNMVSSWTYSVSRQILFETATPSLPVSVGRVEDNTESGTKLKSFGGKIDESKAAVVEPKTIIHPARSTSLGHLGNRRQTMNEPPYAMTPRSSQVMYEHDHPVSFPGAIVVPQDKETMTQGAIAALQELAAHRAELYLVQRRILENIGKLRGWLVGWAAVSAKSLCEGMEDIPLDEPDPSFENDAPTQESDVEAVSSKGIICKDLVQAQESVENFRRLYERLSNLVVNHFTASGRSKSSERVLGDLAILKFEVEDYGAAAMYFSRMAPVFGQERWTLVEMTMLKMYAKCLKKIQRKDDYIGTLLDILARSAAKHRASRPLFHRTIAQRSKLARETSDLDAWLDDDDIETKGYLTELLQVLEHVPEDIVVPMDQYFGEIAVEPFVQHYEGKDGFQLGVQFKHLLEDPITIQRVKVRLLSATAGITREIWLENSEPFEVKTGMARTWVNSNVTTSEMYLVDKIMVEAKRLVFVHEISNKFNTATTQLDLSSSGPAAPQISKKHRVICYPRSGSFQTKIVLAPTIHIDKRRSVHLLCESGTNSVDHAEVRVRAGSAGLRLRTGDASILSGDVKLESDSSPGVIRFSSLARESVVVFQIPYELENNLPELLIRIDATYNTSTGEYQWQSSTALPIDLPLDVNVLDHFKAQNLVSKFNIRTASSIPLEVLGVSLEGTEQFAVEKPPRVGLPMLVYPKQPAVFTYKISPRAEREGKSRTRVEGKEAPLSLTVLYRCLDEVVLTHTERKFLEDLSKSRLSQLERFLAPRFSERVKQRLAGQVESVALLKRVRLGTFEDMNWNESLEALAFPVREEARQWLDHWQRENATLDLSGAFSHKKGEGGMEMEREIIITVPVPRVHILHTASLRVSGLQRASNHGPPVAAVGEMLMAELQIQHTRQWEAEGPLKKAGNLAEASDPLDFVYEIGANPDIWLIGGQRRTQFTARENETLKFSIMLMPLRPGIWLLPTVEIRGIVKKQEGSSGGSVQSQPHSRVEEVLSSETDYQSQGETIQVIPDLRSTTAGITQLAGPGLVSGGTVLLQSEARAGAR